ncbi:peptidase M20 domain-containing protein 2 [Caerostris extrusa]|uniref:Peptidase M20 domain-containing protein 2 n=1 Tax=Caerostris extrusa TaxID=172846 RepID=A0AAV4QZ41_CAEEX|nr:peptidase M20 domain-containing protein 2 [Caerostris extrusa]
MSKEDFSAICSRIEDKKQLLNSISQDIWKNPELSYEEEHAHAVLTEALSNFGFNVQKHYLLSTAFRAEYSSSTGEGPTVAILLEYDALPEIGHACGHNLIAEAGLAAAMAVKTVMEKDRSICGKLVALGTPAEEKGGGKIKMLELGAFRDVNIAMMVHPTPYNHISGTTLCNAKYIVEFRGRDAHAGATPWEGRNALDAAVHCYQSIGLLRQHIKPSWRIQVIITKGGTAVNIIPSLTTLEVVLRTPTRDETRQLQSRVEACFTSAAVATGCEVHFQYDAANLYENVITNKTLADLFKKHAETLGMDTDPGEVRDLLFGSTDMGNVSHVIPSIHPFYAIQSEEINHTRSFTEASGSKQAQHPTLLVSKAMAMTAVEILRSPQLLKDIRRDFEEDVKKGM